MPIALKGSVILREKKNGPKTDVSYKRKCDKCGWIDNSPSYTSVANSTGTKVQYSHVCPKFHNRFDVIIQGTP